MKTITCTVKVISLTRTLVKLDKSMVCTSFFGRVIYPDGSERMAKVGYEPWRDVSFGWYRADIVMVGDSLRPCHVISMEPIQPPGPGARDVGVISKSSGASFSDCAISAASFSDSNTAARQSFLTHEITPGDGEYA